MIQSFRKGIWRLWLNESFLGSFETPEAALQAVILGTVKWPTGTKPASLGDVPPDLDDWVFVSSQPSAAKLGHTAPSADEEPKMADDPKNRGGQDRGRINVNQPHEVAYWTKALGVTEEELRKAVAAVGDRSDAVRKHLGK